MNYSTCLTSRTCLNSKKEMENQSSTTDNSGQEIFSPKDTWKVSMQ